MKTLDDKNDGTKKKAIALGNAYDEWVGPPGSKDVDGVEILREYKFFDPVIGYRVPFDLWRDLLPYLPIQGINMLQYRLDRSCGTDPKEGDYFQLRLHTEQEGSAWHDDVREFINILHFRTDTNDPRFLVSNHDAYLRLGKWTIVGKMRIFKIPLGGNDYKFGAQVNMTHANSPGTSYAVFWCWPHG